MIDILSSDYNTTACDNKKCSHCGCVIKKEEQPHRVDCINPQGHDVTYHRKCWLEMVNRPYRRRKRQK